MFCLGRGLRPHFLSSFQCALWTDVAEVFHLYRTVTQLKLIQHGFDYIITFSAAIWKEERPYSDG